MLMKKNYLLTLVVALLMAVTASAANELAGIYKLSNLTDEQKEALGTISPDAAIRILPGDDAADYYIASFADYGCNIPANYDAGILTMVADKSFNMFLLRYSYETMIVVQNETIKFSVSDNTLTFVDDAIVEEFMAEPLGMYIPGMTFTKQAAPALDGEKLAGSYTFTAENLDLIYGGTSSTELPLTVSLVTNNQLSIAGLIDGESVIANYIPEIGIISVPVQEVGGYSIAQMAIEFGDVKFCVSDAGDWTLITPLQAVSDAPLFYFISGTAKNNSGTNAIKKTTATATAAAATAVSVRNGAIHIDSAEPVSVEVYNAAGVRVYADTVSGTIALPRGIYFVKAGTDAKAVAVAL